MLKAEHFLIHSDLACAYPIVCQPEFKGITQYFVKKVLEEPLLKA